MLDILSKSTTLKAFAKKTIDEGNFKHVPEIIAVGFVILSGVAILDGGSIELGNGAVKIKSGKAEAALV